MDEVTFWTLIDESRENAGSDCEKQADFLIERLQQTDSLREIHTYHRIFRHLLDQLHNDAVWSEAARIIGYQGYLPDDDFLYFCGWLVLQGKTIYTTALRTPQLLSEHITPDADHTCEAMIYVVQAALEPPSD
jgi:hypothetical protein